MMATVANEGHYYTLISSKKSGASIDKKFTENT
jgi:hypothetical protein